jgi:hypothetical protein
LRNAARSGLEEEGKTGPQAQTRGKTRLPMTVSIEKDKILTLRLSKFHTIDL